MSYAPPSGPPPPSVPEGWKAQYDERYHAWFYIDLATGTSQWDRPEAPRDDGNVHSPPPSYNNAGPGDPAALAGAGDKKNMGSNNPYNPTNTGPSPSPNPNTIDEDARLAAKLQAEEDARGNRGTPTAADRGASDDYYSNAAQQSGPSYAGPSQSQSPMPEQEQKRSKGGFLSKLMGKASSASKPRPQQYASYSQQGPPPGAYYGGGGYPPQPGPQPGYGYPGPGYGGGGGYGGYPQQGGYYQQPPRKQGGGMGTAGAAALGVGGGLLGGMLIADAIDDHHDDDYGNNDYGGGGGDDYGGGGDDFGGGDF